MGTSFIGMAARRLLIEREKSRTTGIKGDRIHVFQQEDFMVHFHNLPEDVNRLAKIQTEENNDPMKKRNQYLHKETDASS